MPVRIYDISKKLGLENKEVLAKAKELGIAQAKVPSSSLDKITAEFLEETLAKIHPPPALPTPPAPPELLVIPSPPIAIVAEAPIDVQPATTTAPETFTLPESA